jgi:F0F1-type ATP synthase assembly protein I
MAVKAVEEALVENPRDTRSAQARAYSWASRIMTVSLEMVGPGMLGYWVDGYLGTTAIFTIAGFIGGMCLGMWHLLQLVSKDP